MSDVRRSAKLLGPLRRRSTYRRWVHLLLGGALAMPYVMLAELVTEVSGLAPAGSNSILVLGMQLLGALPLVAVTAFIPAVRVVEGTAARELLGGALTAHRIEPARSWPSRWRTAAWFVTHVAVGAVVSGLTLAIPPFTVWSLALPLIDDPVRLAAVRRVLPGAGNQALIAAVGVVALLALFYLAAAAGALLTRLAPALLGPAPSDRLAALERRNEQLAEGNRLARELHDSVGHALSIVTLQAGAAGRVLQADPAFARTALTAIEESARAAAQDLDHVLGLLRDEAVAAVPQSTLADLDRLLRETRLAGVTVTAHVVGSVERVPLAVSREAYRIVQEGLTNVARHAGPVPVSLRIVVADDYLELEMTNPLRPAATAAPAPVGGGRGLRGIRERVAVLRGDLTAGPDGPGWRIAARVPLRTTT